MITYQQLRKKARVSRRAHCWSPALFQCPQRRGQNKRIYIITPRKPNSAKRKIGKVILTTGRQVFAKIGGQDYRPRRQAIVLVRGSGYKDTPGVSYSIIRGTMECLPLFYKTRRRSIYGARRKVPEKEE